MSETYEEGERSDYLSTTPHSSRLLVLQHGAQAATSTHPTDGRTDGVISFFSEEEERRRKGMMMTFQLKLGSFLPAFHTRILGI